MTRERNAECHFRGGGGFVRVPTPLYDFETPKRPAIGRERFERGSINPARSPGSTHGVTKYPISSATGAARLGAACLRSFPTRTGSRTLGALVSLYSYSSRGDFTERKRYGRASNYSRSNVFQPSSLLPSSSRSKPDGGVSASLGSPSESAIVAAGIRNLGTASRLRAAHDRRQWLAEGHSSFEARLFFFQPEKSVYRKSSIRITTLRGSHALGKMPVSSRASR